MRQSCRLSDSAVTTFLCADRVRRADPDRFAATMASPVAVRDRLWALYALNLEIGRAAWASTEPMIGEMRVQWWVDALTALGESGRVPQHDLGAELVCLRPVAQRLAALADTRRKDCWREPFPDVDALWSYLRETNGVIFAAAGQLCGAAEDEWEPLVDYGACVGMAAWLRAMPDLAARGWVGLPETGQVAEELADFALTALAPVQKRLAGCSHGARVAMLPGWMARVHLRRFAAGESSDTPEFQRRLRLMWAAIRL